MASGASCSISISQNSQNVANNTSSVTISVTVTSWGNTYNNYGAPGSISFGGNISGSRSFTAKFGKNANVTVFSETFTVSHNSDGTASVSASASIKTNTSAGTITANASRTLSTIPRASEPTVSGTRELGSAITINTNRKASGFTHTLRYRFNNGGNTGTIASGVTVSHEYTLPMDFANSVTNATSFNFAVICDTYNGATLIGTKETIITVSIPSSVVPTFESSSVTDAAGYLATYGAYVQGKSNVRATATAEGAYGSTITGITASLDGLSASGANGSTLTLGAPPTTGARTVQLVATDSRGRTITGTKAITVVAYANPTLNSSAYRCDTSTGEEDDESTTVRVLVSGSVHNVNSKGINTGTVKIEYKLETAEVWTTANTANRGQTFSFNLDITGMATDKRYNIRVTVTDKFGVSAEIGLMIMTAQPVLDFHRSGHGIGIGVVANQENLLDIGYDMLARGEVDMSLDSQMAFNGAPFLQPQQSTGRPTIVNHIGLANGMWLQGQLASGNFTNMLRMNESGEVELNWTSGGLKGRVFKKLWEGKWSSGSLTVSEIPYYSQLLFVGSSISGDSSYNIAVLANKVPDAHTDGTYYHAVTGATSLYSNRGIYIMMVDFRLTTPTTLAVSPNITGNYPFRLWNSEGNTITGLAITKVYGVL